jgi:predicted DNA-binding protein (MmcQ/YjbR family)
MDQTSIESWVKDWPGVRFEVKWQDDLVFSVAGKMFAVYCFQGKNQGQLSFKVEDHRWLEWTDQPHVIPAPYLARAHWVALLPGCTLNFAEKQQCLRRSYELVRDRLSKRLQRELMA